MSRMKIRFAVTALLLVSLAIVLSFFALGGWQMVRLHRGPALLAGRAPDAEYFRSAPATLRALGARADATAARISFRKLDGASHEVVIPVDAEVPPSDSFREFRHLLPMDTSFKTEGWMRLADRVEPKPLYFR